MEDDKMCLNFDDNRSKCCCCIGYSKYCNDYESEESKSINSKGLIDMLNNKK